MTFVLKSGRIRYSRPLRFRHIRKSAKSGDHRSDPPTFDHRKASGPKQHPGREHRESGEPATLLASRQRRPGATPVAHAPTADTLKQTVECTARSHQFLNWRALPHPCSPGMGSGQTRPRRQWGAAGDLGEALPSTTPAPPHFAGEPQTFLLTQNRGSSRRQNRTRGDLALALASRSVKKIG